MDTFDNDSIGRGNLKKIWKGVFYFVVTVALFFGGAFAYKFYTENFNLENKQVNNTQQDNFQQVDSTANPNMVLNPQSPIQTTSTTTPKVNSGGSVVTSTSTPSIGTTPTIKPTVTPNTSGTPAPTATPKPSVTQRQKVLDTMHKMANTKVVAEHIWGEIPITDETIKALKSEIESSSFADKSTLLEILERWSNNDFSKAVEDHNYVWEQLGGTVGKATALRD